MNLTKAIEIVNTFNRAGGRPLVVQVVCDICGNEFASQVQDAELAKRTGRRRVCPNDECQREARRRRQRKG